nr:toll/interleukin-1 receptor domain-containing protein [Clostridiales bacterium]
MSRYLAFISYRHHDRDQRISALLRRGLEGCRLPENTPLPKKRRVFRDTDELPTSADLGEDISSALRESEWLIALCSPEYVESKWCMREIRLFVEAGKKDRILPVLVSGDPETSIPPEIRDLPAAGDLRGVPGRSLRHAADPVVFSLLAKMAGT